MKSYNGQAWSLGEGILRHWEESQGSPEYKGALGGWGWWALTVRPTRASQLLRSHSLHLSALVSLEAGVPGVLGSRLLTCSRVGQARLGVYMRSIVFGSADPTPTILGHMDWGVAVK